MPESDRCILAIDLGTSGVKLALVGLDGRIVDRDVEPLGLMLLPDGGAEQDPEEWWAAVVRGTRRMLDRGAVGAEDVVGIGSSVQWSGTVPVDRDGRHLSNAIIWMDARGAEQARRVTDGLIKVEGYGARKLWTWIRLTGGAPTHSGKDPIAHILFLKAERPDAYRATYRFLEPKDWLNLRLTGRFAASFDSITLHWVTDTRRIDRVDYHPKLLRMAGVEREKLPDLVPVASVVGTLTPDAARDLGLAESVRVASGAGDVLAAAIGSGAVRDFEAHLCIGTSSWLVCHVPFKKTDLFHNMASVPSAIPGRYLLVNEQESAGACLTALKDRILFPDDELGTPPAPAGAFETMFRMAERIPAGSDGLIFTPWLNGERTPVDDSTLRGGFFNQSLATTRAHLVRAVLEGVAYNSRWLLTYVERFIGRRLPWVAMIGGGARSSLWCQIHADVLDRPVRQVDEPIMANARGAALQAAVALGHLTFDEVPGLVPIARTFQPNPEHRATYDRLFDGFLKLYKGTAAVSRRLNRPG